MAQNVVAFVGQNENGILRELSAEMMHGLEPHGMSGHVIDFAEPDWAARLNRLADEGILVAWGMAGIGSALKIGNQIAWDRLRVPFVSVLADPPCWLPQAHHPESRHVVLGYLMREWLDVQQRLIAAPRICGLLPSWIPANPQRDRIPWARRSHRMMFIKTGESPLARRAGWARWPGKLRTVLQDSADEACRHGTMGLTDLLLECLHAHGLMLENSTDTLFALMQELDLYVRAARSTRMVEALCRLPVEIVGRGWDHVDRDGAAARFLPAVDAALVPELMADTQFVVNTTPNFGSAPHERVLGGFAARACVVSDHNAFSRTAFADVPSFFGLDWHADDLADRVAELWAGTPDRGADTDPALQLTQTVFSSANFLSSMLELGSVAMLQLPAAIRTAAPGPERSAERGGGTFSAADGRQMSHPRRGNAGYARCLSVHPYYVGTIRWWSPPAELLEPAIELVRRSVMQLVGLVNAGNLPDAKRLAAAALPCLDDMDLTDLGHALAALICLHEGDLATAGERAAAALAARPDCASYHYLCGVVAARRRDVAACVEHCGQALDLDPGLAPAAAALAIIHTLNGDWRPGLAMARRAKAGGGGSDPQLVDLCLLACNWRLELPNESPFDLLALAGNAAEASGFPELPGVAWPSLGPEPLALFVYCDFGYLLEHAVALVWSLTATGAREIAVHLHVANPRDCTARIIEDLRRTSGMPISWSTEHVDPCSFGNMRVYHATARFCRFRQFLEHAGRPVLMVDADCLFRKPPQFLPVVRDAGADIALQIFPDNPLWEQCTAAGTYARPVAPALEFLAMTGRFILRNLLGGVQRWFLDQVALSLTFETLGRRVNVGCLPPALSADQTFSDEAVIWTVGISKSGNDRYNAYKRDLLAHYGDLRPLADVALEQSSDRLVQSLFGPMIINRHDMYIGAQIAASGLWAKSELVLLRHFVAPGDTVVDAGANIGSHTLAFALWTGAAGTVHAFEPQAEVHRLLARNVALNGWSHVHCHGQALGAHNGDILVPGVDYTQHNNFGAVSLNPEAPPHCEVVVDRSHGIRVPLVTLDSLGLAACQLIKIDVEGMELDILHGAEALLERCRPLLYLEFHTRRREIGRFLRDRHYRIYFDNAPGNPNLLAVPAERGITIASLPEISDDDAFQ